MRFTKLRQYAVLAAVVTMPGISAAVPISTTDLWDLSNGVTIDGTSGVLNYRPSWRSDARDMFGGAFGTSEAGNTNFKDYNSPGFSGGSVQPGFVHYMEWSTPSVETLRSFALHAANDNTMNRRAFNRFQLFTGDGAGSWTSIYDTGPGFSYIGGVEIAADVTATSARYFRAEFVQAPWVDPRAVGPRIVELDGFDTFLDGSTGGGGAGSVPEPTTLALLGLGLAGIGATRRKKIA